MEERWLRLQRDLADRHPKGRFIIARDSAHNIPVEQPGVVIEAIRMLIEDR
jgi:pimeloyl-ACP methyl ester carboxylesterase